MTDTDDLSSLGDSGFNDKLSKLGDLCPLFDFPLSFLSEKFSLSFDWEFSSDLLVNFSDFFESLLSFSNILGDLPLLSKSLLSYSCLLFEPSANL